MNARGSFLHETPTSGAKVPGMSRAVFSLLTLLITAGCAQTSAADPAAEPAASRTPHADDLLVYRDTDARAVEVCGLVPAQRIGELLGRSGVEARESGRPDTANQVGACTYTAADVTLNLAVHMTDPTLPAEEFATLATEGRGRPIRGLGDAAALATYDDGYTKLVAVRGDRVLLLTGTGADADAFTEIAEEALPGLASLS